MISRLCLLLAINFLLFSCKESKNTAAEAGPATAQTEAKAPAAAKRKTIVFFGNSITAGYGLTDAAQGYVALVQQRLDSLNLPYQAVNAGLSGETSAGGKERVDWVIKQPVDIFVLELGGNDALRGIAPSTTFENLGAIIKKVKAKHPAVKVVLAGMQAPPNMGQRYTKEFGEMYPRLAKEHGTALVPFILENVGGIPELNQSDRIHPNEKGQFVLRENIWKALSPLLSDK